MADSVGPFQIAEARSVGAGEDHLSGRLMTGVNAAAWPLRLVERDDADGRADLILQALLVHGGTGPIGAGKAGLHRLLQLVVALHVAGVLDAELEGALEEAPLDLLQQTGQMLRQ